MRRLVLSAAVLGLCATMNLMNAQEKAPLMIAQQGGFSAGGRIETCAGDFQMSNVYNPVGQSVYGDHLYTFFQIPVDARKYPLIFLHGGGMSKRCWTMTPDGREGFQELFLRKGYGVYLVDQPRIGEAAVCADSTAMRRVMNMPNYNDHAKFALFRLGPWPDFYEGVQFPQDSASVDQFLRQGAGSNGNIDLELTADAMSKLVDRVGGSILVTHSANGTVGWRTALLNENVKAIVAYEPGGTPFLFPKGEAPAPIPTSWGNITPMEVETADFEKLVRIPIVIYYGDNIATEPVADAGQDQWRGELQMARQFAEAINSRGGDCTVIHLPEIGIKGNTHFPFLDLNNVEVANVLDDWLKDKNLDIK